VKANKPSPSYQILKPSQCNECHPIGFRFQLQKWLAFYQKSAMVHNETTDPENPKTLNPTSPQNST